MSSHNKRIIILIYTKDCSDTEGYKNQMNFVAQKMATSEVLSTQCINQTLILYKANPVDNIDTIARHFNAANHSITNIKVCAISPISGGNDSRKRHEKLLNFKIGAIHPHGLNKRFSFI